MTGEVHINHKKLRFDWKRAVNASDGLSRGAKHMATFLCDNYVNKNTGRCWPKNQTVSEKLGLSKRTVQRHIKELLEQGWLVRVRVKNARRAMQINFPRYAEGDNEDDNLSSLNVTELSLQGDAAVTPYKNQVYNQGKGGRISESFATVAISDLEELWLGKWKRWLNENTCYEVEVLFERLRIDGTGIALPGRFPSAGKAKSYLAYFKAMAPDLDNGLKARLEHQNATESEAD